MDASCARLKTPPLKVGFYYLSQNVVELCFGGKIERFKLSFSFLGVNFIRSNFYVALVLWV